MTPLAFDDLGSLLSLCTPRLMSTLIDIIHSRPSNLQSFTFYPVLSHIDLYDVFKLLHNKINFLQTLLVLYSQKLRRWIEGGMQLHLFLCTFSLFQSMLCQWANGCSRSQIDFWFGTPIQMKSNLVSGKVVVSESAMLIHTCNDTVLARP